ncbi:bifunctional 4-hydroxy-2-oxoglutarate aldolase/2-dehydro-3-deoxy-phosphogluconate aldolase [Phycicoccus sp. Soil748]|uniref:bifunctional 4-hydroxy-2-oxoglutarate aldolase/2-dehydro-3-deoxy-phosphogluconate aldolase n=1 Tax=Intrasporangiaceae TaxID=85021 RepID=UPI000703C11C|nr:bifunctional 4-hydroxy-2-oxoglutarate aldolase/2-dehydro-3-deoxy-phosphogluconate aldolase [Phycicoccus sp. Soil748]KRE57251.1 aldolase [Phycicoccus sp. Soil748]
MGTDGTKAFSSTTFVDELSAARVMAIIRGKHPGAAEDAAVALLEEGVRFVEVALTTPSALEVIRRVRAVVGPDVRLGAGTVLTAADVDAAVAAGADFVVTPAVAPSVAAAAERGVPCAAGAFTATEAHEAHVAGAAVVKLFPASLGGPSYLRALRDPFPDIPFMAVGGVDVDAAPLYLSAGAVAVGVGGPLVGDAASGGDLAALRERARSYVELAGTAS